jgi:hypothetical protein
MKLGQVIEEYQDLQTHLNLITDLTGSLVKMLSTMSYGTWLFLRRSNGGGCCPASLIWDMFLRKEIKEQV